MKKWKNTLVLLLALVLLAMGALIPWLVSLAQDGWNKGKLEYAELESMELILKEAQPTLSILEKIELFLGGAGVEVTEGETQMTAAQAIETMKQGLQPYQAGGLLPDTLDNDVLNQYAILTYEENDPRSYNILWFFEVSLDAQIGDRLSIVMDDETGKILALEFMSPTRERSVEGLYAELDLLSTIYLKGLDITPDTQTYGESAENDGLAPALWCEFVLPEKGILTIEMVCGNERLYISPVILD